MTHKLQEQRKIQTILLVHSSSSGDTTYWTVQPKSRITMPTDGETAKQTAHFDTFWQREPPRWSYELHNNSKCLLHVSKLVAARKELWNVVEPRHSQTLGMWSKQFWFLSLRLRCPGYKTGWGPFSGYPTVEASKWRLCSSEVWKDLKLRCIAVCLRFSRFNLYVWIPTCKSKSLWYGSVLRCLAHKSSIQNSCAGIFIWYLWCWMICAN